MRIRKLALLAAVVSLPLAGPVLAADAIMEQPPEPPVAEVLPQTYVWAGGYLGGYGEYKWGEFDAIPADADGFGGGVYGGYNWQTDNIVYGVEADVGYSGADVSSGGTTAEQGFNGSLRARLGMDVKSVPDLMQPAVSLPPVLKSPMRPARTATPTSVGLPAQALKPS